MMATVLITGCSSEIGAATVHRFAKAGWNVAATLRNPAASGFEPEQGCVETFALDVTDPHAVDRATRHALKRFGAIDVLINNAGYGLFGPFETATAAMIARQFRTNVGGVLALTRSLLPHMRARGSGVIINVASLSGLVGMPLYSLYAASKFAMVGFSEALSHELAPLGIRVKVFAPGAVLTQFSGRSLQRTFDGDGGAYRDSIRKAGAAFQHNRDSGAGMALEQLAQAPYDAATDGSFQVRYVVGEDAQSLMQARHELGEEALLAALRERFGLAPAPASAEGHGAP